jgi:Mitochondrial carrier protein
MLLCYSCVVFVPVDVVKERLQVQIQTTSGHPGASTGVAGGLPMYNGSLDALIQICRHEGLKGIYKGYGATLLTYGPFSALYFFLYEEVIEAHI